MHSERALQRRSSTTSAAVTGISECRGTADEVGGWDFTVVALGKRHRNDSGGRGRGGNLQDSRRWRAGRKRQAERANRSSLAVRAPIFIRVHVRCERE